jgi:integrase
MFAREGWYYFRRAVPKGAENAFGGKAHVTIALGTSNLAEARHALADRLKEFDRAVANSHRRADPTLHAQSARPLPHVPGREEIDEAARAWLRQREGRFLDDELPARGDEDGISAEIAAFGEATARGIKARPSDPELLTQWIADHLVAERGWVLPEDGRLRKLLLNRVARAQLEWAKMAHAELEFEPRPLPDALFSPDLHRQDEVRTAKRQQVRPAPIMALFNTYSAEAKPRASTVKAWKTCLQSLVDYLGHDDATKVSKMDVVGWKDSLLAPADGSKPLSHATISKKYLAAAKTVFGWAERNLKLEVNPADKVVIVQPAKARLRSEPGLSETEAKVILRAAFAAEPDASAPLRGFARRWIPWLCAYSGARVGEIAQLRGQDIFKHEDGVWCIRITPEAGSQKANRTRDVPIHPHLIDQGFLEAVAGKVGPLFYDPAKHRGGKDGNPQYKKVAERIALWVRELGVTDPNVQPNHGWRHRFKRVARSARMDHEARDNIQGHAARTEGDKYGGTTIQFRFEEICKLPRYQINT